MGLFDILIGAAILNDLSKKHEKKSSDSIFGGSSYNRGYSDGYDDAWHDLRPSWNGGIGMRVSGSSGRISSCTCPR